MAEARLNMGKALEPVTQDCLQLWLVKSITPRIAILTPSRFNVGEGHALEVQIDRAIVLSAACKYSLLKPNGLHGSHRLVIDGYRPRLGHRREIAFKHQGANPIGSQQIGQGQPAGATSDNNDREAVG